MLVYYVQPTGITTHRSEWFQPAISHTRLKALVKENNSFTKSKQANKTFQLTDVLCLLLSNQKGEKLAARQYEVFYNTSFRHVWQCCARKHHKCLYPKAGR